VLEAAAVGIPDREYGQEIRAYVVLKPGIDCRFGRAACPLPARARGGTRTPKEFRVIAELPKGPSGKVQRLKLVADMG
jgi:long-chain acyl-CoA synthetase